VEKGVPEEKSEVRRSFEATDLDDKVDELVLVHLLGVKVGDEKADIVALVGAGRGQRRIGEGLRRGKQTAAPMAETASDRNTHLYGLAAQHEKAFRAHHHKAHKLFAKDFLNLVGLSNDEGSGGPKGARVR
jgi:hypothetical protein